MAHYLDAVLADWLSRGALPDTLGYGQEPLSLEGYLALEKAGPEVSDAQHIHHKLLYDAANQAIIQMYASCNHMQVGGFKC